MSERTTIALRLDVVFTRPAAVYSYLVPGRLQNDIGNMQLLASANDVGYDLRKGICTEGNTNSLEIQVGK